ncbi:MAG: bifunctional hydroxymethylpyrimidine kinase/phosphomethylpyrimidine kinase [Lachnospiraceae bacterium]|nr:bifunctional hydroxymethylpyrimidine kinase/phosphomethylpyrimidine kinase [Lachnospiraceae bacterium]
MKKNTALTIAGSDPSGGAGIQADLKTMKGCGVFGMSAVTAITAQNTTGVRSIFKTPGNILKDQIDAVFEDIRPDAVKIGMTASAELISVIAERLAFYKADKIVLDPVMVSTSGAKLMEDNAAEALKKELMPLATLITPNIPEACVLAGVSSIETEEDMVRCAKQISGEYGCAVLLKGGHMDASELSTDILCLKNMKIVRLSGKRLDNPNTHGTGCTLSSAIASFLARGYGLVDSVERGKRYLTDCIAQNLDLGAGSGPLWHI